MRLKIKNNMWQRYNQCHLMKNNYNNQPELCLYGQWHHSK